MSTNKVHSNIFLIRHGEVQYPLDQEGNKLIYGADVPLADLGRIQLKKLGKKLNEERIGLDVIAVSPYARAQESAHILQRELQVPHMYIVDDLKDVSPNSWEGHLLDEIGRIGGDIYANPRSSNQETLDHLTRRSREAIEGIVAKNPGESIGIVAHGDLLSALDWTLKTPEILPSSYKEMKDSFYLHKGQAREYTVDPQLQIVNDGRFITVEEVNQSIEGFRRSKEGM